MPRLIPMSAVWYDASLPTSEVIAPPYDVLDEEPKRDLLAVNDRNIVKVDLPVTPPKTVGPQEAYNSAGEVLRGWLSDGTLRRVDKRETLFAYRQSWEDTMHPGRRIARVGVFCAIEAEEFGRDGGGVHRHELTIKSGTQDRMLLTTAAKAQLSPVFGFLSEKNDKKNNGGDGDDEKFSILSLVDKVAATREPDRVGETAFDSVKHELWAVDDEFDRFAKHIADKDVFIADGHHRYNMALQYSKDNLGGKGPCLIVLCSLDDPGLVVLPYHRVITGLKNFSCSAMLHHLNADVAGEKTRIVPAWAGKTKEDRETADKLLTKMRESIMIRETDHGADNLTALEEELSTLPASEHAVGLFSPHEGRSFIITSKLRDPIHDFDVHGKSHSTAWRELDAAVLHHVYIEVALASAFCDEDGTNLGYKYTPDVAEGCKMAAEAGDDEARLVAIVRYTPVESVCAVSEARDLMPPKSTYFFPKLATGLIINLLGH